MADEVDPAIAARREARRLRPLRALLALSCAHRDEYGQSRLWDILHRIVVDPHGRPLTDEQWAQLEERIVETLLAITSTKKGD